MRAEGVTFAAALKQLADSAGISLDGEPINRQAEAHFRHEAEVCKWWWDAEIEALEQQTTQELALDNPDEEWMECLCRIQCYVRELSPAEMFDLFRRLCSARDRREYARLREEDRLFDAAFMALAQEWAGQVQGA